MADAWGKTFLFACGHAAVVMGDHPVTHPHYCPVCEPGRRAEGCDVEYLDAH